MAFLWICIHEVKAKPAFEGVPGSFLKSATIAGQEWSYLLAAEGRSPLLALAEHIPALEIPTLQLILWNKEVMGKVRSHFLYGAAYRAGLDCAVLGDRI